MRRKQRPFTSSFLISGVALALQAPAGLQGTGKRFDLGGAPLHPAALTQVARGFMQIFLPIAEVSVNAFVLIGLGGLVGLMSGLI